MLQTEFTQRTQIWVKAELFEELHKQYMSSTLDKDAWCKQYKRRHDDSSRLQPWHDRKGLGSI